MSSSEFAQMVASGTEKFCCTGFWVLSSFELLNSGERFKAIMALLFTEYIKMFRLVFINCAHFFHAEHIYLHVNGMDHLHACA